MLEKRQYNIKVNNFEVYNYISFGIKSKFHSITVYIFANILFITTLYLYFFPILHIIVTHNYIITFYT